MELLSTGTTILVNGGRGGAFSECWTVWVCVLARCSFRHSPRSRATAEWEIDVIGRTGGSGRPLIGMIQSWSTHCLHSAVLVAWSWSSFVLDWKRPGALILVSCVLALASCSVLRPEGAGRDREAQRVYRVQLQMTKDKQDALQIQRRAKEWWSAQPPSKKPPLVEAAATGEVVIVVWQAPLYRVRLGPFASRSQAESVLSAAQETFPDAFVVPDRIRTR